MMRNPLRYKMLGNMILAKFYLFLALFHIISSLLFSTKLIIVGKACSPIIAFFFSVSFVLFLIWLARAIKKTKRSARRAGLFLHGFFLLNVILVFLEITPFFDIQGQNVSIWPTQKTLFFSVNILINGLIILYFMYSKDYYIDNL
ncbi:MAG: hypothetical protein PHQ96_01305 [Candidatus Omnitrophica bacterium]|nr:hypothetical protein [Candidatus Omnitrophota bacterium]